MNFSKQPKMLSLKMQEKKNPGMYMPSVSYTSSIEFCNLLGHLIANTFPILIELREIARNLEVLKFCLKINRCFTKYTFLLMYLASKGNKQKQAELQSENSAFTTNGSEKLLLTLTQAGLYHRVEIGIEEIGESFLANAKLNPGS